MSLEVKHRLRRLAMTGGEDGGPADVVFVEVGGTVGDYENGFYIEAASLPMKKALIRLLCWVDLCH